MSFINTSLLDNTGLFFYTQSLGFPAIQIVPTAQEQLTFYGQTTQTVLLKNIKDPVSQQDAATKNYIDNIYNQSSWKQPAYLTSSSTVNISSAPSSIDGISVVTLGTRILLKSQTSSIENGIYSWNGTGNAMTRTDDFPSGQPLFNYSGAIIAIKNGSTYENTVWQQILETGSIGSNDNTWTQFGTGGSGSPGGSNTQIQFNANSSFGGSSNLTFITNSCVFNIGVSTNISTINMNNNLLKFVVNNTTSYIECDSEIFNIRNINDTAPIYFFNTSTSSINYGTLETINTIWGTTDSTSNNTGAFVVNGGIGSNGTIVAVEFSATSDIRQKSNITPLTLSYNDLKLIKTYSYNLFNNNNNNCDKSNILHYGIIAQDLENTPFHNIVRSSKDPNSFKSINYIELIPILINSINDLSDKYKKLDSSLQYLAKYSLFINFN